MVFERGLNIIAIERLGFGLMFVAFKLASNVPAIKALNKCSSLQNTVIVCHSTLVWLPLRSCLSKHIWNLMCWSTCNRDYDRCILELDSWIAFMISFEQVSNGLAIKAFSLEFLNLIKLSHLNTLRSKLQTATFDLQFELSFFYLQLNNQLKH